MTAAAVSIIVLLVALVGSWFLAPAFWATQLLRLWRRHAGLYSQTASVNGIRWHFLRGGQGPTLLLLHGFGADTSCWLPLAAILGQRFSLLIPDLPGFGESEPPHELHFSIRHQTQRLIDFLDNLEVEECLVAGNSMGGYLAASLAATDPARVRGIWLLAPLGVKAVPPGKALEEIDSGQARAGQVNSISQFRDEFLPSMFYRKIRIPYPLLRMQAEHAISRQDVVPWMLAQARFESEPLESIAKQVRQPTLVQWGENDQIVNPAGLPLLDEAFENSSVSYTPECGHLPMFERPGESSQLFLKFLRDNDLSPE